MANVEARVVAGYVWRAAFALDDEKRARGSSSSSSNRNSGSGGGGGGRCILYRGLRSWEADGKAEAFLLGRGACRPHSHAHVSILMPQFSCLVRILVLQSLFVFLLRGPLPRNPTILSPGLNVVGPLLLARRWFPETRFLTAPPPPSPLASASSTKVRLSR